jgi:predicted nucleotidyltransferase
MARTAVDLTAEEVAQYRDAARRERVRREELRRTREHRAQELAGQAANLLRERFGATRVVLFGSLARGDFSLWSDVDIAVWGTDPGRWLDVIWDVFELAADIDVNVVIAEGASPGLLATVEREGRPV